MAENWRLLKEARAAMKKDEPEAQPASQQKRMMRKPYDHGEPPHEECPGCRGVCTPVEPEPASPASHGPVEKDNLSSMAYFASASTGTEHVTEPTFNDFGTPMYRSPGTEMPPDETFAENFLNSNMWLSSESHIQEKAAICSLLQNYKRYVIAAPTLQGVEKHYAVLSKFPAHGEICGITGCNKSYCDPIHFQPEDAQPKQPEGVPKFVPVNGYPKLEPKGVEAAAREEREFFPKAEREDTPEKFAALDDLMKAEAAPRTQQQPRDERQKEVAAWCAAAFGAEHQSSVPQRGLRMLEEAIEAYQSATMGMPAEEMRAKAHALVDYVMERVAGNLAQECGGVGLTLLALCEAAGISADAEELREVERVKSKPLEHFSRRNQAKNEAGFNLEVRKPEGERKA